MKSCFFKNKFEPELKKNYFRLAQMPYDLSRKFFIFAHRIHITTAEVCIYCGYSKNIQQYHLRDKCENRVTTVPACAKCNQNRGAKAFMEWFRWLKHNDIIVGLEYILYNAF